LAFWLSGTWHRAGALDKDLPRGSCSSELEVSR
jgi:hypothetical protein